MPQEHNWQPTATWQTLRARARLLSTARSFFACRNSLEVDTPVLGRHSVSEPNLESLAVSLSARPDIPHFLQTSPEYAMKKLLAAGGPDLFQLGNVFRNGELGRHHQPEFTLVEWYRRDFSMAQMIEETGEFIATMLHAGGYDKPIPRLQQHAYTDLFRTELSIDPLTAPLCDLQLPARQHLQRMSEPGADSIVDQLDDDRAALLDLLLSHIIIPSLPPESLSVIHHYPADQAALARLDPEDATVAERFEVFFGGQELANGYRELTDAGEQQQRFAADQRRRAARHAPNIAPDPGLLAALEHGLPECCGVAVGFDRLVMCALGLDHIDAAVSFPL